MPKSGRLLSSAFVLLCPAVAAQQGTTGPTVQAFLFGDVLYTEAEGTPGSEGFRIGQTVAHGNVLVTNHVAFFGELSLTGRDTGYGVEVERAILRYDFSDALKVSAGRYHTPISYWNTAYHHGLWLQGSVARPEAVKFGSRFIPVHFVGALAEGRVPGSPISYAAGVGNGRADNIARAGDAGDANGVRALVASVSVQPASLFGFRIGGAVYVDDVPIGGGASADERIADAHVVWERGRLELIGEVIHVSHEAAGGPAVGSHALYAHAGVRLDAGERTFTPYARWERIEIGAADAVFTGVLNDYDAILGGVRWDFSDFAALKVEYRNEETGGGSRLDSVFVQASFAVPITSG